MCLCKVDLEKARHRGRFDDRGGEGDMTMEADTGVMWPQTKECNGHQKMEEAKKKIIIIIFLRNCRRNQPYLHLDFSLIRLISTFWPPEM